MAVIISNEQEIVKIPADWTGKINKVVEICLQKEDIDPKAEVSLLFVDNETIRAFNHQYRQKDVATDVLSFPMYEADEPIDDEEEILFGDIIISLERAQKQAIDYQHSLEREVMYLLVHGLLHLSGYDHIEEADKKIMRQKEEELLTAIGVSR